MAALLQAVAYFFWLLVTGVTPNTAVDMASSKCDVSRSVLVNEVEKRGVKIRPADY